MRAPSTDREHGGPQPNKESSVGGEKEKQPVVMLSRDRTRARKPEKQGCGHGLLVFNDSRMTKLITTGGLTAFCTQGGVVVWKQLAVPEIDHRRIILKGFTKEADGRSREVVLFTGPVRTPDSKNEILHKRGGGAGAK